MLLRLSCSPFSQNVSWSIRLVLTQVWPPWLPGGHWGWRGHGGHLAPQTIQVRTNQRPVRRVNSVFFFAEKLPKLVICPRRLTVNTFIASCRNISWELSETESRSHSSLLKSRDTDLGLNQKMLQRTDKYNHNLYSSRVQKGFVYFLKGTWHASYFSIFWGKCQTVQPEEAGRANIPPCQSWETWGPLQTLSFQLWLDVCKGNKFVFT